MIPWSQDFCLLLDKLNNFICRYCFDLRSCYTLIQACPPNYVFKSDKAPKEEALQPRCDEIQMNMVEHLSDTLSSAFNAVRL